jgi:hypothetical protein
VTHPLVILGDFETGYGMQRTVAKYERSLVDETGFLSWCNFIVACGNNANQQLYVMTIKKYMTGHNINIMFYSFIK